VSEVVLTLLRIAPFIALVSLRVAVVLALMPSPFGDLAPMRIRAVLSFLLAMVLCIPHLGRAPLLVIEPGPLLVAAVTEVFVGSVIGLTARVTLAAAEIAGTIAGNAMGLGFAGSIDPLFGQEALPTTALMNSLGVLTFFALRGHHALFEALYASLSLVPAGEALSAIQANELTALGANMVAQGLRIASPVVATLFIVQLGTALVARAAPRVQIFALSFGVTVSVGALVLVTSAPQVASAISTATSSLLPMLTRVLRGGGP
jgi:flagellar biosynthetic protein FliR